MSAGALRIAVTGLAAMYPFGGVFWDYLQYPLGLMQLGHDVLYIEDTGKWSFDPVAQTFVENGGRNAASLARWIDALMPELRDRWFFQDACGRIYGRPLEEAVRFCRSADLFINVSASCQMREHYFAASKVSFIDSDPMYTQASVPDYLAGTIDDEARQRLDLMRRHDVFFTFGENIGAPDCRIPPQLFGWHPTRQPVVLGCFADAAEQVEARRHALTTVASWEPTESGFILDGVRYCGKSSEFERFLELPSQVKIDLELAMSGRAPTKRLLRHGWKLADPSVVAADPKRYRGYLAHSLGEWSVAKNAYVAGRSGWFSCRSACYLALGVPVIVQDTGFECSIPSGEGVLSFSTADDARDAIDRVLSNPQRHATAARAIAEEYFDAAKVLSALLERAFDC